jgi:hypothetical protein
MAGFQEKLAFHLLRFVNIAIVRFSRGECRKHDSVKTFHPRVPAAAGP